MKRENVKQYIIQQITKPLYSETVLLNMFGGWGVLAFAFWFIIEVYQITPVLMLVLAFFHIVWCMLSMVSKKIVGKKVSALSKISNAGNICFILWITIWVEFGYIAAISSDMDTNVFIILLMLLTLIIIMFAINMVNYGISLFKRPEYAKKRFSSVARHTAIIVGVGVVYFRNTDIFSEFSFSVDFFTFMSSVFLFIFSASYYQMFLIIKYKLFELV